MDNERGEAISLNCFQVRSSQSFRYTPPHAEFFIATTPWPHNVTVRTGLLDILFRQITTFIKVHMAFVFEIKTL